MLFLVATPVGNLGDISQRALDILKESDYILCEDTRHTGQLLRHFDIQKPLKSFHKFNEAKQEDAVILDLKQGKNLALVSDAGTPTISDPGNRLVQRCILEEIPVTSIPGPCAAIIALTCSGLNTDHFQFLGFLPKKEKELHHTLMSILQYTGTTICYESPLRLVAVLKLLLKLDPNRFVVIARELTKKFEQIYRGTSLEQLEYWQSQKIKGEIILLISGQSKENQNDWQELSANDHVEILMKRYSLSKRDAIKLASEQRGVSKRSIYNVLIDEN